MIKNLHLKTMLLLCAMILGIGSAWADNANFAPSNFTGQGTSGTGSAISATVSGVTLACDKGYGTTQIRCYSGGKITISSSNTITAISFTFSGSYTGGLNTSYSNVSKTSWEATLSSQARITAVTVTYTSAGDQSVATSVTIDPNGITNTDVYTATAAGSLSATVKDNNNTIISGASVTWSSSDENVATINANGVVTLVAAGTATITATYAGVENQYLSSSATYELTVTSSAPYVQPTKIEINLNDNFFGTSYGGTASGITDDSPISGSKDNVTITYAGSGNHYVNSNQIRFYPSNKLTFEAPSGYTINNIVFTSAGTWAATISTDKGTYNSDTKTWTGSESSVIFSGSGSSRCDISKVTITLSLPPSVATPTFSVASGTYYESQSVEISCETSGATIYYTTDNTEPTSSSTPYTTAISITETTTLKAIAIKDGESSNVASATYTIKLPLSTISAIFEEATSTETNVNVTFGNWVVSGVNGSNAYVTDNNGNGFIIYKSAHGFAVNDKLSGTVTGTPLKLYKGAAEFTNLATSTEGLTVSHDGAITVITDKTIADLGGVNTGAVITLNNLTYKGTNLSDGTNTIKPYNSLYSDMSFTSGKTYNVTGVYVQYDNTKEILPRSADDIVEVVSTEPSIVVTPAEVNVEAGENEGTMTISYENLTISDMNDFGVQFCDAEGDELPDVPSWIEALVAEQDPSVGEGYLLSYIVGANNGDARTAYLKLFALEGEDYVYSNLVTITQAKYVADYTTLPFSWNGGASAEFLNLNGVTASGLSSDYADSNAPYLIKFDSTDDYIQVKTDGQIYNVTLEVKMIGGANTSTITVQGSTNGEDFTDVERLQISGAQNDVLSLETTNAFNADYRYVRLVFTKGSNVGVGPITINCVRKAITSAGYATYCSPYALDFSGVLGLTAYTASLSGSEESEVSFSSVANVAANTGVLLKGAEGTYAIPVASSSINNTSALVGVNVATEKEAGIFVLMNTTEYGVGFYKAENAFTVGAHTAYIPALPSASRNFIAIDDATAIKAIESKQQSGEIYNLAGQRVKSAQKGLYIIDGKKVVIK